MPATKPVTKKKVKPSKAEKFARLNAAFLHLVRRAIRCSKPPAFIGFDLSLHNSARVAVNGHVESPDLDTWGISRVTVECDAARTGEELLEFYGWCRGTFPAMQKSRPTLIGVEGYSMSSRDTGHRLAEFGGSFRTAVGHLFKPEHAGGPAFKAPAMLVALSPMTIKRYITGVGGADKLRVMDAVRKSWPEVPTDHAADAYSIALFLRACWETACDNESATFDSHLLVRSDNDYAMDYMIRVGLDASIIHLC